MNSSFAPRQQRSPWRLTRGRDGAAGVGENVAPLQRRWWSAGRRRTPTSLGCARRRNGARRTALWSARGASQAPRRRAALHFPRCEGEGKRERATPGARKQSAWAAERWLPGLAEASPGKNNPSKPTSGEDGWAV